MEPDTQRGSLNSSPFERQMMLESAGPGRRRTVVSEEWNCPFVPHGGIVTAITAAAMTAELNLPSQQLRSVTAVFAGPVTPGPAEVGVTVLRRGTSVSQLLATLCSAGEEAGVTALAAFGGRRPGFEFTDLTPPEAPPPSQCRSFRDPPPPAAAYRTADSDADIHFSFWDRVEGRIVRGHAPWDTYVPVTSERVCWYRFDEPPIRDDGSLDPLALVALCDTMPGAVAERMGPNQPAWYPPSVDLTVHLLGETRSEWILARNRARHAGGGYASTEIELWDPGGDLLAYGTQVMIFSFPAGPPPAESRRPPEAM
ncbi:MAG: acyl-CoA thioesterase [Micromonosporaceae bacterium]